MDVNGTRFHLLLGERDWLDRTALSDVAWDAACGDLTLKPLSFEFPAAADDRPPTLADRRGAARDAFGNWYWIGASSTEIIVRSSGSQSTGLFWSATMAAASARETPAGAFESLEPPASPSPPLVLRGLTVTTNHYLVAGVLEPKGVLVFDLHAGGAPEHLCWPHDVPFAPIDMAPSGNGGVWVLVRDGDKSFVWGLDAAFRVISRAHGPVAPDVFAPADGTVRYRDGSALSRTRLRASDAWTGPDNAIAIEALPGDTLVILDRPPAAEVAGSSTVPSTAHYYAAIDQAPQALPLRLQNNDAIVGHDLAFVAAPPAPAATGATDPTIGTLYVVSREGNQTYAFTLRSAAAGVELGRILKYYPMRLFGGKALVNAGGAVYYDFDRTWIPLIDQRRPRYVDKGGVALRRLDGHQPDCVWHRLLIDGVIPSDASVDVSTRAANSEDELATMRWSAEPRPYLRSRSELPFAPEPDGDGAGTWDLLFQNARGRFLELRLALTGNGRSTPRLRAVRVYYPRFSYLQYLPAVYRQDRESASFLDRFLANIEGTLTSIEDRIAAAQALIDMRSAPPDALEWLASWVGLALDPTWDDDKRRMLLQHAPQVFAKRGTADGLRIALALSLSPCATPELFTDTGSRRSTAAEIRIVEQFRTRRVAPVFSGDPTELTGLREVTPSTKWTPEAGRDSLDAAWGNQFPLAEPRDRDAAQKWRTLARQVLGFVPATAEANVKQWRQFLAGRYHGVAGYNDVYGRTGLPSIASFDDIELPTTLPPDGAPLLDWYEFETRVLAMTVRAHRFLVLLPIDVDAQADAPEHQRALDLARRIVTIEKPAHTVFDVRFYWALFRVGEVRLGLDTLIARRRNLITPLVLNQAHLAESYLAPSHPQDARDRTLVTGRGRLEPRCRTGEQS